MDLTTKAAITTLGASRWELMMVRLFGKKIVSRDGDTTVTMRRYRGRFYVFHITKI